MPPCLPVGIIRYVLKVRWSNPGKGVAPSLTLSVVAIEKKKDIGSPSAKVANFTYLMYLIKMQSAYSTAPTDWTVTSKYQDVISNGTLCN